MPANALSNAHEHLIDTLATVKIIAVWSDYAQIMWSEELGMTKSLFDT